MDRTESSVPPFQSKLSDPPFIALFIYKKIPSAEWTAFFFGKKKNKNRKKKRKFSARFLSNRLQQKKNMNWELSSLIFVLGVLAAIACFVLFIIACVSTTPFNMTTRTEGLLVAGTLGVIAISTMLIGMNLSRFWHAIDSPHKVVVGAQEL